MQTIQNKNKGNNKKMFQRVSSKQTKIGIQFYVRFFFYGVGENHLLGKNTLTDLISKTLTTEINHKITLEVRLPELSQLKVTRQKKK